MMRATSAMSVALATVALAQAAPAQSPTDGAFGRPWTYELQLYIWGTEVGGEVNGTDFEIGFDDLVENLNGALMGGLRAYSGPWMTYGELGYARIEAEGSSKGVLVPAEDGSEVPVDTVSDATVETTVVSFGGGYQLADGPSNSAYATFGARYFRLESDLALEVSAPEGDQTFGVETDEDYWDAVIGVTGRSRFGDDWFASYLLDVGAGQSDLTWQAAVGIGYTFGRNDLVLGYRHMEWDLPDEDVLNAYSQSGPILLWNFRF